MKKAAKEDISGELAQLKSSLTAEKGTGDFHLPEAYFESLPERIQAVVARQQTTRNSLPVLSWIRKHALATAFAGLVGLAAIGFLWMNTWKNQEPLLSMEELFEMEFFSLYANLDAHYLYDMVLETDLSVNDILYSPYTQDATEEQDAIIDYLYNTFEHYSLDTDMLITSDIQ